MKEKTKYLTINAFAKLFGITKHTLYHYEEVGIFRPIYISESDYRYYSYTQYDQLRFILLMREMGVSLDEIRSYLNEEQDIEVLLQENLEKIEQRLAKLEATKAYMKNLCDYAHRCKGIQVDIIEEELLPERRVYGAVVPAGHKRHARDGQSYEKSLEIYAKFCYDYQVEASWMSGSRIQLSSIDAGDYFKYDFTFTDHRPSVKDDLMEVILPAGRWLSIHYQGSYEMCYQAYAQLMKYAEEHQLVLENEGYEFYITNNIITQREDAQIIKVTVKVREDI